MLQRVWTALFQSGLYVNKFNKPDHTLTLGCSLFCTTIPLAHSRKQLTRGRVVSWCANSMVSYLGELKWEVRCVRSCDPFLIADSPLHHG